MNITVSYDYRNSSTSGQKTVVFHDCKDTEAARDYAAKVTNRALESKTELVLNMTCDEGWLMTTIVAEGDAHTLYLREKGISHRKLS